MIRMVTVFIAVWTYVSGGRPVSFAAEMFSCPAPPIIEHGKFQLTTEQKSKYLYVAFDEIEVVCDPGYVYNGESEYIVCSHDLQWDNEFGECRESYCSRPNIPEHGSIVELENNNASKFAEKFELTYVCDDGYRLLVDDVRSCRNGRWTGKEPLCKEIRCYPPPAPEDGNMYGNDFRVGSRAVFSCFSGFDLIGSAERFCLPSGRWSGELARCNLRGNYCPNPGVPIKGSKIGNSYDEGDVVKFTCESGFMLIGSASRKCLPDHTWSGHEAECLGAYDFDNKHDISVILKSSIAEIAEAQATESKIYEERFKKPFRIRRTLDLNYSGRYIFYFVFDVSGSIKERNFNASIRFAKALVRKIGSSNPRARIGAVAFSSRVSVQFHPFEFTKTEDVLSALDTIEYKRGGTATQLALKVVREELIPLMRETLGNNGGSLKSVIFLFTDGKSNIGGNPKVTGDLLKAEGVEIYCIGITGDLRKNELYDLGSQPVYEHVFMLKNYVVMDWLIQEITNGTIDFSKCGLASTRYHRTPRIVGGDPVIEPWPWMGALYDGKSQLKCGASIIAREWILTGATCLVKQGKAIPTSDVTIKLGLTYLENTLKLQEFEAERFVIHSGYKGEGNYDYDIALIKLSKPIEYNSYVRPVCLPPEVLPVNSTLYKPMQYTYVTGWGHDGAVAIGEHTRMSTVSHLKEVLMPIQERSTCSRSKEDLDLPVDAFTERMFCSGYQSREADACVGDSGGPVMQQQINEEGNVYWTQVGIVSWGVGCGQPNTYSMNTHVQSLVSWIHSAMEGRHGVN